jgi:MFS family permease
LQKVNYQEQPKLWTRDFILICLATFFIFCAFQILMPILPKYVQSLGADEKLIGLISGVFTITALISRPFIGRELDRGGRRSIYLLGLIIFFLAVLGYLWAPTLLVLLAFRFVHGVGWAGASTAAGTIVADIVPPSRRGEGMGYYGVASTLAMAIAPALGLTLLVKFDYSLIFILSLVLTAGAFLIGRIIAIAPPTKPQQETKKTALFDLRALRPSLVMLFMTLPYGGLVTFLPIYAAKLGMENIGPFFTIYAIGLLITRPLAGKYYDRRGPNIIVSVGMIAMFLGTFILGNSSVFSVFLVCGFLYGIGFGSVQPTLLALALEGVEPQKRGSINGTVFSAFDLGIGIGSVLLGVVADSFGFTIMYTIASIAPLAGLALFFLWPKKLVKNNEKVKS